MFSSRIRSALFSSMALLLCLPVMALLSTLLVWNEASIQVLQTQLATVLPSYAATSLLLCLGVGLGVSLLGASTAVAVTLFNFPGRSFFEWALLLPMAIPAYVVAYAYTDFLQYSGPLQHFIREQFLVEGRVFPEIRSLTGAVLIFTLALYPYVFLLVRSALAEKTSNLMEAARMLGAPLQRRIFHVALPLSRPAIAAGVALAMMETLADFGVSSYFGIQTFTTGIYKSWLVFDDRIAAAQLANLLLFFVFVLIYLEKKSRSRIRFATLRQSQSESSHAQLITLKKAQTWCLTAWCAMALFLGFVLPVLLLIKPLIASDVQIEWHRFFNWTLNSLRLSGFTALLAVVFSLGLIFNLRTVQDKFSKFASNVISLGYAIPGSVVVVGLMLPVTWLQATWPEMRVGYWMTATALGLTCAYLVRFCAVALESIQSGYANIPQSLDDSSRMLGVAGYQLLARVHAPLLRRSILAALLLVFVDVMKELPVTLVLRPFNTDTLAVMAYQLARDERLGEAALPSLALVLAGLLPVIFLNRAMRTKK